MIEFETYMNKIGSRKKLYHNISKAFNIKIALYPGSHIDITPSFYISNLIYVDSFKGTRKFFSHKDDIMLYVNKNKIYDYDPLIQYIHSDYYNELEIPKVDLIISMYAGFVSLATKKYLKMHGIILANDSHADATLLNHDPNFELIAVVNNSVISSRALSTFFQSKKVVDINILKSQMKPPKYIKIADQYIFRKVK